MTTLLIDADVVVYRVASIHENVWTWPDGAVSSEIIDGCHKTFDLEMQALCDLHGTDKYFLALTDRTAPNWRLTHHEEYKANRKDVRKPELLADLREYATNHYGAVTEPSLEGDDIIGIAATTDRWVTGDRLMVSIDKDFLTVPGRFWVYGKGDPDAVISTDEAQAEYQLAYQTLTGDRVDNYKGCPGIGPKRAEKILSGLTGEDLWDAVCRTYESRDFDVEEARKNWYCARILRGDDYNWETQEVTVTCPF